MSVVIFLMNSVFIDILRMPAVLHPPPHPNPHPPPPLLYILFYFICNAMF